MSASAMADVGSGLFPGGLGEGKRRVHLIGVGGMAMSGIAAVLLERGFLVSGSDREASSYTQKLESLGAQICIGHDPASVEGAAVVVYSAAIPAENPERRRAQELGIPILRRAEIIGRLMDERSGIAVAGTHGKTTTAAMIAVALERAGLEPGFLIGAAVEDLDGNGRWGKGRHFVVEADEYDSAFLQYRPQLALITHLEPDHLDYFGSVERMVAEFRSFTARVVPGGALIVRKGAPLAEQAAAGAAARVIWFGERADWSLEGFQPSGWGGSFAVVSPSGLRVAVKLSVPGLHNAFNALAAIAAASELGLPPEATADALSTFRGADRRFRLVAQAAGLTVVEDYAHHPTEVRAALSAAKSIGAQRVWAVFQPHLRSRTKDLFNDFAAAFADADRVTIVEIFSPSGREDAVNVSGADLGRAITNVEATYQSSLEGAFAEIVGEAKPGDLILLMGAGDINRLGRMVKEWLRS